MNFMRFTTLVGQSVIQFIAQGPILPMNALRISIDDSEVVVTIKLLVTTID